MLLHNLFVHNLPPRRKWSRSCALYRGSPHRTSFRVVLADFVGQWLVLVARCWYTALEHQFSSSTSSKALLKCITCNLHLIHRHTVIVLPNSFANVRQSFQIGRASCREREKISVV